MHEKREKNEMLNKWSKQEQYLKQTKKRKPEKQLSQCQCCPSLLHSSHWTAADGR